MSSELYDDFAPPEIAAAMRVLAKEWRLVEMCGNCPFQTGGTAIELADGRLDEIEEMLAAGGDFYCHKTANGEWDDYGETYSRSVDDKLCAGACDWQDDEGYGPSQFRRIAERLDAIKAAEPRMPARA